MSYLHQRMGAVDTHLGICKLDPWGYNNLYNDAFAEYLHNTFLQRVDEGSLGIYKFDEWKLLDYEKISINFMCWEGEDMWKVLPIPMQESDEAYLTSMAAKALAKTNIVLGSKVIVHYAYCFQQQLRENLDLLEQYSTLANHLTSKKSRLTANAVQ